MSGGCREKSAGKWCLKETEGKERTNGGHKMSNFIMPILIFIFLISTKSYSFFLLLLFTKENVTKMYKNEISAFCAVYNSLYLPGSTHMFQYSLVAIYILSFSCHPKPHTLISPLFNPRQDSGERAIFSESRIVWRTKESILWLQV